MRRSKGVHPLVRESLESLGKGERWLMRRSVQDGLLRTPRGVLEMSVRAEDAERAGQVLDRFVRAVEGPGVRGEVVIGPRGNSFIQLDGVSIRFKLKQELHWTTHKPNKEERKALAANPNAKVPRVDWQPEGGLAIELWSEGILGRPRVTIADSPRGTVEEKLRGIRDLLLRLVADEKERRTRAAAAQAELEEAERARARVAHEGWEQRRLHEELLAEARRWHDLKLLQEYLALAESHLQSAAASPESPGMRRLQGARGSLETWEPFKDPHWSPLAP